MSYLCYLGEVNFSVLLVFVLFFLDSDIKSGHVFVSLNLSQKMTLSFVVCEIIYSF